MNEDINQELQLMEIINSKSLNDMQIQELIELIRIKDKLDKFNCTDRRFMAVESAYNKKEMDKRRLILQRYAMLYDAQDPMQVTLKDKPKLRPRSELRFKFLKRDKFIQEQRVNNFKQNFLQKAL